jgi:hypothetical protein
VPGNVEPGHFHFPHGIGVDNMGRVLVCDRKNHRIQLFSQDGEYLHTWTGFRQPCAVDIGPDDTAYVPELQARVTISTLTAMSSGSGVAKRSRVRVDSFHLTE